MACDSDDCCYDWNGWGWFWIFFIVFFLIILIALPWGYYRNSDYCGEYLPPERYQYRPSRVIVTETD